MMDNAIADGFGGPVELLDAQRPESRMGASGVHDSLPSHRGFKVRPLGVQRDEGGDADAYGGM